MEGLPHHFAILKGGLESEPFLPTALFTHEVFFTPLLQTSNYQNQPPKVGDERYHPMPQGHNPLPSPQGVRSGFSLPRRDPELALEQFPKGLMVLINPKKPLLGTCTPF